MDWLKAVSQLVAKEGQPMSWITPLGLPVLQPYRRTDQFQVTCSKVHVCSRECSRELPCVYSSVGAMGISRAGSQNKTC